MNSRQTDLITVIVPVYNAEPYLSRCVESVIAQNYYNIEVILVDDGSTDRCGDICDRYAASSDRITTIHKTHGGPGSARSAGMRRARGEYIGFVDADDYISPTMYEDLHTAAVRYQADIVQTGMIALRLNGAIAETIRADFSIFTTPRDCFSAYLRHQSISRHLVNKLYDRRILESQRMIEGYLFEDPIEVLHLLRKCQTFVVLDLAQYFIVRTPNSITRGSVSRWHLESILYVAEKMRECILVDAPQCCGEMHRLLCRFSLEGYRMVQRAHSLPPHDKSTYMKEFIDGFERHYARLQSTRAYRNLTLQDKTAFKLFAIDPELYRTANNLFVKFDLLKLKKAGVHWDTRSGY